MMDHDLLFGYVKMNNAPGSPASSVLLYRDGTMLFRAADDAGYVAKRVTFSVTKECVRLVKETIRDNLPVLSDCAARINGARGDFDGENYFIFGDLRIIDWDLTRWYLEEDRKKHPEYYNNSVKVQLTETCVRGIFDEICGIIEQDDKTIRSSRAVLKDL